MFVLGNGNSRFKSATTRAILTPLKGSFSSAGMEIYINTTFKFTHPKRL